MALVATSEGCAALWQQLLGLATLGPPFVRLVGQAFAPKHSDTLATYAALELAVGGYAPVALKPSVTWQVTQLPNGAQAFWPVVQWGFTGACSVFGYWLNDVSNTHSLWAEAFPAPLVFPAAGGPFQLALPFSLTSQP